MASPAALTFMPDMKYKGMLWDGYKEVAALAEKLHLRQADLRCLQTFVLAQYNAGANDAFDFLKLIFPILETFEDAAPSTIGGVLKIGGLTLK